MLDDHSTQDGPAFPIPGNGPAMSLLDYFAGQLMPSILRLAQGHYYALEYATAEQHGQLAKRTYDLAYAMVLEAKVRASKP